MEMTITICFKHARRQSSPEFMCLNSFVRKYIRHIPPGQYPAVDKRVYCFLYRVLFCGNRIRPKSSAACNYRSSLSVTDHNTPCVTCAAAEPLIALVRHNRFGCIRSHRWTRARAQVRQHVPNRIPNSLAVPARLPSRIIRCALSDRMFRSDCLSPRWGWTNGNGRTFELGRVKLSVDRTDQGCPFSRRSFEANGDVYLPTWNTLPPPWKTTTSISATYVSALRPANVQSIYPADRWGTFPGKTDDPMHMYRLSS